MGVALYLFLMGNEMSQWHLEFYKKTSKRNKNFKSAQTIHDAWRDCIGSFAACPLLKFLKIRKKKTKSRGTAAEGEGDMADLKCVVENCTYNKDCLCSKGDIMVGGKHACDCDGTCCESFAQKREGRESFSNSLSHPSHTISIDCEAVKCIYNSNYKCVAEHVDIKGCGASECRETACATFSEK